MVFEFLSDKGMNIRYSLGVSTGNQKRNFGGLHCWISVVLDNLAVGQGVEDILKSYPSLSREAIQATLAYAAEIAKERMIAIPA